MTLSTNKKLKGSSLLEVIIATSLLSMVGVLLAQMLSSSIDLKEEIELQSNRYHLVRQAMARMTKELSMAYISKHKNAIELVVDTQFLGNSDEISFVAFGNVVRRADAKISDQREISYYIGKDKRTGKKSLLRKIKVNPGLYTRQNGVEQTLCTDITELKFSYWDSKVRDWKSQYSTQGFEKRITLPERVKIEITTIVEGEETQKFLTQSELHILKPILLGG